MEFDEEHAILGARLWTKSHTIMSVMSLHCYSSVHQMHTSESHRRNHLVLFAYSFINTMNSDKSFALKSFAWSKTADDDIDVQVYGKKLFFFSVYYYYHHHDPIPACFHLSPSLRQRHHGCWAKGRMGRHFRAVKFIFWDKMSKLLNWICQSERARICHMIPDRRIGCDSSRSSNLSNLIAGVPNLSSPLISLSLLLIYLSFLQPLILAIRFSSVRTDQCFLGGNYRGLVLITGTGHRF